jgi:signal transduction histidine kinase
MAAPLTGRYRAVVICSTVLFALLALLAAWDLSQAARLRADAAASRTLALARAAAGQPVHGAAAIAALESDLGTIAAGAARDEAGELVRDAFTQDPQTRALLSGVDRAWRAERARLERGTGAPQATALLDSLLALERSASERAQARRERFRIVQIGALGSAALVLAMLLFQVVRNLRSEDAAAERSRAETLRILDTVSDGLFLLDANNRIGQQTSQALRRMFRREDVSGSTLEELLGELIPEATRRTALEYVALMWGERVNENLIRTLNPLAEVEVRLPSEAGGTEVRYFSFEFSRVRLRGRTVQVLCAVADVTERVQLARDLADAQARQHGQLDLLLSMLQVEPLQLAAFLSDAEAAMTMVNSVLKLPARDEAAFRDKLDRIFREVHTLKSEAAALALRTVEDRAHRFEDALSELRSRRTLSGNDFLPLAVKLDDLFGHLASLRDLVGRLEQLRRALGAVPTAPPAAEGAGVASADATLRLAPAEALRAATPQAAADSLEGSLRKLATRVAGDHGRRVTLVCLGLEEVPSAYSRPVRDVLYQLVRNAVVHGIEPSEERLGAQKSAEGTIVLEFKSLGEQGYELSFQDDGRGLDHERIRAAAVARGIITPDAAATMDPRKLVTYIFRPGFSTAESVSKDAGRGVGMDLVRELIAGLGGRISLSTRPRKFTRFRILLPAVRAQVA